MTACWRNDIGVGHFVRSDTSHVMQAIDITRHSRITQQLVPSTTALSFVCCSQFACKKKLLMTFGTALVVLGFRHILTIALCLLKLLHLWTRLCACKNWRTAKRIVMKFGTGEWQKIVKEFKFARRLERFKQPPFRKAYLHFCLHHACDLLNINWIGQFFVQKFCWMIKHTFYINHSPPPFPENCAIS